MRVDAVLLRVLHDMYLVAAVLVADRGRLKICPVAALWAGKEG